MNISARPRIEAPADIRSPDVIGPLFYQWLLRRLSLRIFLRAKAECLAGPEGKFVRQEMSRPTSLSWPSRLWICFSPVIPLVFLIGWYACRRFVDDDRFFYLSLVAAVATSVFILFTRRRIETFLPITLLFVIFLAGYYFKFYWLVLNVEAGGTKSVLPFVLDLRIEPLLYPPNLLRAFELSTWGYVTLCISAPIAVILKLVPSGGPKEVRPPLAVGRSLSLIYLCVSLLMTIGTAVAIYQLGGGGVLGREAVQLPYKLGGIIHYTQTTGALLVGLVLAWADRKGMKRFWWGAFGLILLQGLLTVFVRASRAFLIGPALSLGTLWLVYKRFTKGRMLFVVVALLSAAFLRPAFTAYRQLYVAEQSVSLGRIIDISTQAFQAYEEFRGSSEVTGGPLMDLMVLTMRIVGVDSVLYLTAINDLGKTGAWSLDVLLGRESLALFLTQDVLGYGPELMTQFTSPSLVGALYMLGGIVGIVAGVLLLTLSLQWFWQKAYRANWWTAPLVLMTLIGLTFTFGSEGVLDAFGRDVAAMTLIVFCIEVFSRMRLREGARS